MKHSIRDLIDWEQPFPPEEYAERRRKVRAAMARAGIDGLFVTGAADVNYLTGYDQIWHAYLNVIGLFLRADDEASLFFDNDGHVVLQSTTPDIEEVCVMPRGPAASHVPLVAEAIHGRGWAKGRIALQPWCYGPHPALLEAIGQRLAEAGAAEIADGSNLVEDVRLIKSPREVAVVREAARVADLAMAAARDALAPGLRETDVDAAMTAEMMRHGCGYPAIRSMVGSGPRSGAHHGPATHRRLKAGDVVHVDFCTSLHRYHVNLSRSFSVGEADPRWVDLMDRSAGCIDAVLEAVRPGQSLARVQEVADAYTDAQGLRPYVWLIGGYSLGIAMPPDWVGRHRPKPREDVPIPDLVPGLVFNYENQFDVFEGWPGGTGAAYIETFLVGEDGLEVLSALPRTLVAAGG
ncbi:MAG: Xaa-Pro peptidase family protein [Kiloniellales bacterium]|nr:Xaa-Pro peptidase family protein [Kiloniellales bacterium]